MVFSFITPTSKYFAMGSFLVFTLPSFASKHVKATPSSAKPSVETHHPKGWRFTDAER